MACQRPPRGVETPRALSASAMVRSVTAPDFWISAMISNTVPTAPAKVPARKNAVQEFMAIEVAKLTVKELGALAANHRNRARTDAPLYVEALAELAFRQGKGLNFKKTKEIVLKAARENRFVSYKDLADGSGVDWGQAHYAIGAHLFQLVEYAHLRGCPLLSAIVVNKPNVVTGEMEPSTLRGFVEAARALKIPVTDELAFLRAEQKRVFAWAKSQSNPAGARQLNQAFSFATFQPLARALRTLMAYQRPPRGVETPRALSASAMARSVTAPDL
jgi:hypothetical protein